MRTVLNKMKDKRLQDRGNAVITAGIGSARHVPEVTAAVVAVADE